MRYLGGKSRIAKKIAKVILEKTPHREVLIEPFMGGGAMTATLAPHFNKLVANDLSEDLILMWRALKEGWEPPQDVSLEEYNNQKAAKASALRGFVGFGGTWGGKWFGGYARGGNRNYYDESRRSLLRDIRKMQNVDFSNLDYRELAIPLNAVVYADPPYQGTTGYKDSFDHEAFWKAMSAWAKDGATVFVSEYSAPQDWVSVWEHTSPRSMKSDLVNTVRVTEKLWTPKEKGGDFSPPTLEI